MKYTKSTVENISREPPCSSFLSKSAPPLSFFIIHGKPRLRKGRARKKRKTAKRSARLLQFYNEVLIFFRSIIAENKRQRLWKNADKRLAPAVDNLASGGKLSTVSACRYGKSGVFPAFCVDNSVDNGEKLPRGTFAHNRPLRHVYTCIRWENIRYLGETQAVYAA